MVNLAAPPAISLVTLIELKGGAMSGSHGDQRRRRLNTMLRTLAVIGIDEATVEVYSGIVGRLGFSRARILDRLIAATAVLNGLTLVTINGAHFRGIPDLKLEVWTAPGQ